MRNWKKVKLGDLLTESKIVSEKPDANKRLTVRLHTEGIEKRPFSKDKKGATKYYIRSKGQFIYGRQNLHKGAFGIVPEEFDGFESSADIPAFDIDKSCLPEWIYYFFRKGNFYFKLEPLAKGVGSKRINPSQIFDLDILLPPIKEQEKLLERVSNLNLKNGEAKSEFENQKRYIAQLRHSITEDAVNGKLTAHWRELNIDVESGKTVLKKIVIEKNRLIQLKKLNKERELIQPIFLSINFEIPKSWEWCNLDEIVSIVSGFTKGKNYKTELISTKYLRVANVQRGFVDISDIKKIIVSRIDFNKYQLESNDLLIIEGGDRDKVGRCAIWKNEVRDCIFQNHIYRLRPYFRRYIDEYFLMLMLNSNLGRIYFSSNAKQTTNLASINKNIARAFKFPLPPIEEQKTIALKVRELINKCDILENESVINLENAQKIFELSLVEILGTDINKIENVEEKIEQKIINRKVEYDNNTTLMDLVELIKTHGKLHAEDLWKMSKFPKDIDAFYAELKHQIEDKKSIKEVENEKGYLELV